MPVHRTSTLTGIVAAALCTLALPGTAQKLPFPNVGEDPSVTPVAGPSWLTHLGVPINRTFLGQGSGRYGPAADQPKESRAESLGVRRTIDLTGADLYRLNCQACHGESGRGTPPEIKSVLGPVQGSSRALVQQRLQAEHDATASADSVDAAARARMAIVTRLHKGGARMPPRAAGRRARRGCRARFPLSTRCSRPSRWPTSSTRRAPATACRWATPGSSTGDACRSSTT
jgi:hypothetical protein